MKIALLSRNPRLYSTRRLVQAARKRGHKIEVVDVLQHGEDFVAPVVDAEEWPDTDVVDARITEKMGGPPKILNTCVAYSDAGPLVKRRWPHLYTGVENAAAAD